jgi:hypothetical protein
MFLCYIDESGTTSGGNTSHYVLAGLSIPIEKWKLCEAKIQRIKIRYGLRHAEIHTGWLLWPYLEQSKITGFLGMDYQTRRHEVEKYRRIELLRLNTPKTQKTYHKTKKNYKQTEEYIHLTYDERKNFVMEIASLIGTWAFARLFAECIDKIHFNPAIAKSPVDEQAFEQVVSRFEQYLQIYSKKPGGAKQYGLLIHDNNPTVCKRHTELMKEFHSAGTFWTKVENIVETPFFVDSRLTGLIQLADVCSYAIRRYIEKGEAALFNEIFKVADKKGGKVVGIRHFTSLTCSCLICQAHR